MMMPTTALKTLLIPLVLTLLLAPRAQLQDGGFGTMPPVSIDDLQMSHFQPQHVHAHQLFETASELFGRRISVKERGGLNGAPIHNIQTLGNALVLLDEPAKVEHLLKRLRMLDESGKRTPEEEEADESEPELQTVQWSPRHVGLRDAYAALTPFHHNVEIGSFARGASTRQLEYAPNVSLSNELNLMVLRDVPESLTAMTELLESLDKPSPQFLVSALVIEGRQAPVQPGETAAPKELVQHLGKLLPFEHFVTLSTGLVRTSANADEIRLNMPAAGDAGSQLEMRPMAFDEVGGSLTVRCEFQVHDGRSFITTASIPTGEYTVLGASGARPLFLVLRLAPLGGSVAFGEHDAR